MQTNENHPNRKRIRNFFREKGYYIVLALCVCAVGVSGWLFVSGAIAEKKKERTILMDSASAQLTRSFREWWKQGDYRFRFQAGSGMSPARCTGMGMSNLWSSPSVRAMSATACAPTRRAMV